MGLYETLLKGCIVMKNPVTKIKKFAKDHAEDIFIGATGGAIAVAAYAAGIAVHKYIIQANDVVVPAHVIAHLKNCSGQVMSPNAVPGFELLIELIPNKD